MVNNNKNAGKLIMDQQYKCIFKSFGDKEIHSSTSIQTVNPLSLKFRPIYYHLMN